MDLRALLGERNDPLARLEPLSDRSNGGELVCVKGDLYDTAETQEAEGARAFDVLSLRGQIETDAASERARSNVERVFLSPRSLEREVCVVCVVARFSEIEPCRRRAVVGASDHLACQRKSEHGGIQDRRRDGDDEGLLRLCAASLRLGFRDDHSA